MFQTTQLNRVPTGLLLDYAVDFIDFNDYDGLHLTDSNKVSNAIFENALFSLQSADVLKTKTNEIRNRLSSFETDVRNNNISLGLAFYFYNFISEDALTEGKIDFTNGQVFDKYDAFGNWINPYEESTLFCFSPNTNNCEVGPVTFKFNSEHLFTNASIDDIMFDAGIGEGFTKLSDNQTYTYNEGIYELKLKVQVAGKWYQSHSFLNVLQNTSLNLHDVIPSETTIFSAAFKGEHVSAQMTSYVRTNAPTYKPFIVVEGFDPWELTNALEGKKLDSKAQVQLGSTSHITFHEKWKTTLLSQMYDLFYIDWNNSTSNIKANAQLLKNIITYINEKRQPTDTIGIVLMGQSMGGLVARYALVDMEAHGQQHWVTNLISHDTPHLGANVPLGGMYFARSLLAFVDKFDIATDIVDLFVNKRVAKSKNAIRKVLDSDAVGQMLFNNVIVADNGSFKIKNDIHEQWQKELNLFGFPKGDNKNGINNIAIVNGRDCIPESSLVYNDYLLYVNGNIRTRDWVNILPLMPSCKFSVNAIVKPYIANNAGKEISNLEVKFRKKFLWTITKTSKWYTGASYNAPSEGPYYDSFSGSWYSFPIETLKRNHAGSNWIGKLNYDFGITDRIMFIPTASALSINENIFNSEPLRDYYTNPPKPAKETPFTAYYISNESKEHITLDNEIFNWLSRQLQFKIDGPDNVDVYGNYSTRGVSSDIHWETSDEQIAIIDETGHLTATGNGFVTITAWNYQDGKRWSASKKVLVSFPDMVLSSKFILNEGCRVSATVIGTDDEKFCELMKKHNLEYEWTMINENLNMITTYSSENYFSFLPEPNQSVTICVRLVNKFEHRKKGKTYSLKFNPKTYFNLNYDRIIVNSSSEVYFMKGNSFDLNTPTKFTVQFGGLPPVDDVQTMKRIMQMVNGEYCFLSFPKFNAAHDYGEEGFTEYLLGSYSKPDEGFAEWEFDYFNNSNFILALNYALNNAGQDRILTPIKFILKDKNRNNIHRLVLPIVCISDFSK